MQSKNHKITSDSHDIVTKCGGKFWHIAYLSHKLSQFFNVEHCTCFFSDIPRSLAHYFQADWFFAKNIFRWPIKCAIDTVSQKNGRSLVLSRRQHLKIRRRQCNSAVQYRISKKPQFWERVSPLSLPTPTVAGRRCIHMSYGGRSICICADDDNNLCFRFDLLAGGLAGWRGRRVI